MDLAGKLQTKGAPLALVNAPKGFLWTAEPFFLALRSLSSDITAGRSSEDVASGNARVLLKGTGRAWSGVAARRLAV